MMNRQQNHALVAGVDVGATKIEIALVDNEGHVVESERCRTDPGEGPNGLIDRIIRGIKKLQSETSRSLAALGLGIAGQVDANEGVLRSSPNLGWKNALLMSPLEDALEMPVLVTNDVSAATWGEWTFGAGRGANDLICVFIGTGVGAGVISGGRMLEGPEMSATELGHVPLVFDGRKCSCRHQGCLEAYVGGWAIAERAQEAVREDDVAGGPLIAAAGSIEELTAEHVSLMYKRSDPLAQRIVEETSRYLAAAAVGMVNTFSPSLIVLGGGVIEGIPEIAKTVEETVRHCAFSAFVDDFRLAHAALGDDSGVVGAAALARGQLECES